MGLFGVYKPWSARAGDPRLARDFLNDGIALAATLHTYMRSVGGGDQRHRRGQMTYVPAIYSMRNTR